VWVVATAWACGMRGISTRGVIAVTGCLAAYCCMRFLYLSTGMPGLEERTSGLWLRVLEPEELVARFGANPTWFYAYNVATSFLSVPFADPSDGVFQLVGSRLEGYVPPRLYVAVAPSTATTALIGWAVIRRFRRPTSALYDTDRQLLVLAGVVLIANSVVSFAYTRHEILSVAGAFYAFAAFVTRALRHRLLVRIDAPDNRGRAHGPRDGVDDVDVPYCWRASHASGAGVQCASRLGATLTRSDEGHGVAGGACGGGPGPAPASRRARGARHEPVPAFPLGRPMVGRVGRPGLHLTMVTTVRCACSRHEAGE